MRTVDKGEDMPRVFRKVLTALARNRDDQRVRTIAADAGYSPSHTQRIIRKLAARGLIRINSEPGCQLDVDVLQPPQ